MINIKHSKCSISISYTIQDLYSYSYRLIFNIHFMILVAAPLQRVVVELYASFCGNRSSFNDDIGNVLRILR